MIGIPYARQVIKGKRVFAVCPVCHEHIALLTRKDEDSFSTRPYADHYQEKHAQEVKTSP